MKLANISIVDECLNQCSLMCLNSFANNRNIRSERNKDASALRLITQCKIIFMLTDLSEEPRDMNGMTVTVLRMVLPHTKCVRIETKCVSLIPLLVIVQ